MTKQLLVVLLLSGVTVQAQDTAFGNRLRRVSPGSPVAVVLHTQERIQGRLFQTYTEGFDLAVCRDGRWVVHSIDFADVTNLQVKKSHKPFQHTLAMLRIVRHVVKDVHSLAHSPMFEEWGGVK